MAQLGKKRARQETKFKSKKRQRVDGLGKLPQNSSDHRVEVIPLEKLAWKEVPLPERLDDAEGFLGLEEIENVEVVTNSKDGKLGYRVGKASLELVFAGHALNEIAGPQGPKEKSFKRSTNSDRGAGAVYGARVLGTNGEHEEWTGFDKDFVEDKSPILIEAGGPTSSSNKFQTKEIKKPRISKKTLNKASDKATKTTSSVNAFEVLGEAGNEEVDVSAWQSLGLSSETLSSLSKLRFSSPTPIQISSIPEIIEGHDVVGKASTGSGKTLAFGIPILEYFLKTRRETDDTSTTAGKERQHPPIAMILSPTRELAHQLSAHLTDLYTNVSSSGPLIATVTGGLSLQKQQRLLIRADIIIGTPGRLWEIISEDLGLITWLKKIRFLVVDEADRLLSQGHFQEIEEILNALDRDDDNLEDEKEKIVISIAKTRRQTLVFSATFQKELQQKLAGKSRPHGGDLLGKQESMEYLLKKLNFREDKPKFIDVNPVSQMASRLKEGIVECAGLDKDLYLYALLLHYPNTRTLIFTNSIASVRRLTPFLQNLNIPAQALHSQMPQKARLRAIERFSSPSNLSSILVATDVAARGLDIPSVQLVVHYHLPRAADMYVHRSGRTARAQKSGSSILLCAPEEVQGVRRLVAKVHARNTSFEGDDNKKYFMRTIDLDRRIIVRVKPRVALSKIISDASLAKEKKGHEDNWLRTAADDLGVDYDSDEFAAQEGSQKGRGQGRKKAERESRSLSKGEVGALKAELRGMLAERINVGISERYLTSGSVDVDELLEEGKRGEFLGRVGGRLEEL